MDIPQSSTPYYSGTAGNVMMGFSTIYTTIAHVLSSVILRAIPFLIHPSPLNPSESFSLHMSPSSNKHVAIVTGSNTGIGYQTSLSLVEKGYDVILACRSRSKAETAAKSINQKVRMNEKSGKAIFLHPLDLTSFHSVQSFSEAFSNQYSSLNILVNNAGLNASGNGVSENNLDVVFQANSIGHFLLTKLLLPRLLAAKNIIIDEKEETTVEAGRIVNLSSTMHHFCVPAYETQRKLYEEKFWEDCSKPHFSTNTYTESKLAAILFSMELNKRFGSKGIRSISVNPGAV